MKQNKIQWHRLILVLLFFPGIFSCGACETILSDGNGLHYDHNNDGEVKEWSKIIIEEVFISKKTHQKFQDTLSEAEFGWELYYRGNLIAVGPLYSEFYVPIRPDSQILLNLVEKDAFESDDVSAIRLYQDEEAYEINNNGDFVILSWRPFFPERNSGKNAKPEGATVVSNYLNSSVNFNEGDYTDYIANAKENTLFLIDASVFIQIGKDESKGCKIYPNPTRYENEGIYFADCRQKKGLVRIRGSIDSGKKYYTAYLTSGPNRKKLMLDKILKLGAEGRSTLRKSPNIFYNFMPNEIEDACQQGRFLDVSDRELFCAVEKEL